MEQPLTRAEIRKYESRLLDERAWHALEVEAIEDRALTPSGGARFQEVDESIEEAGLESDLDVLAMEDRLGYELEEALQRIRTGIFGLCEECGATISRRRLDVLPHARSCAACARESAMARSPAGR